jgi:hypothetical protein
LAQQLKVIICPSVSLLEFKMMRPGASGASHFNREDVMISSKALYKGLLPLIFALVVTVGLPTLAHAQGRGRGRGLDKKAEKFINGHDARDGRWDGRGPSRDRFDDDYYYRRSRRHRDRDDDDYYYGRRRRVRDDDYIYGRRSRRHTRARRVLGSVLGGVLGR